jgi:hypothetical protein
MATLLLISRKQIRLVSLTRTALPYHVSHWASLILIGLHVIGNPTVSPLRLVCTIQTACNISPLQHHVWIIKGMEHNITNTTGNLTLTKGSPWHLFQFACLPEWSCRKPEKSSPYYDQPAAAVGTHASVRRRRRTVGNRRKFKGISRLIWRNRAFSQQLKTSSAGQEIHCSWTWRW